MGNSFRTGEVWRDTNGKRIQAHSAALFYKDGTYYWYGENKEFTKPLRKVWHWGVRCYTSQDLYNWEDRGLIIPPQPEDLNSPLHPTYCMDRPHILYCEKTGKYVAWLKIMSGVTSQFMSVLQADDFFGPYEFVHKMIKPLDMDTGDFTLVQDEASGKAYFVFDRPHFEIGTATLSDDYTGVTGEYSAHYSGMRIPESREAPAYFTRNGKHYLFTSGTTSYYPNQSRVAVFEDFHGEYTDLGVPHIKDKQKISFNSQISCVLKVPGKDLYIACADRWKPKPSTPVIAHLYYRMMDLANDIPQFDALTKVDYSPKELAPLSGKETRKAANTSKANYVWLPVQWAGDKPYIEWKDEWRWEDY